MERRRFLRSLAGCGGLMAIGGHPAWGLAERAQGAYARVSALPKCKITRIRYYKTPTDAAGRPNVHQPLFNQSTFVVVIETDQGLTGVGEGGVPDIMEQCAGQLIGEDPFRTEKLWQLMFRGYFYPAGREKTHTIGALDVALWDLKAKALGVPLYQLLGGLSRNHVDCYATGFSIPGRPDASHRERARACMEAGFHTYRLHDPGGERVFDRFAQVERMAGLCREIREGCGRDGGWAIDFHGEFDLPDAVKLADLIYPLGPYFCEDMVRSDQGIGYKRLREKVKVPIAVGEVYGDKWEWADIIDEERADYVRLTIPNVGGVTEFMKLAAMAETHHMGIIPHFTGPISEAAIVHCVATTSVPVIMEMVGDGKREWPYLKSAYDFRNGRLWPNDRPGHGCEVDTSRLQQIGDFREHYASLPTLERPDGSYTNW